MRATVFVTMIGLLIAACNGTAEKAGESNHGDMEHGDHPHTNELINETSPYLLQHAHNPVNWYPWGDEALQKAQDENKLSSLALATQHVTGVT